MSEQEYTDKELTCVDCGTTFLFEAGEQQFFREKGFENDPKRCKPCRQKKKERKHHGGGDRR